MSFTGHDELIVVTRTPPDWRQSSKVISGALNSLKRQGLLVATQVKPLNHLERDQFTSQAGQSLAEALYPHLPRSDQTRSPFCTGWMPGRHWQTWQEKQASKTLPRIPVGAKFLGYTLFEVEWDWRRMRISGGQAGLALRVDSRPGPIDRFYGDGRCDVV